MTLLYPEGLFDKLSFFKRDFPTPYNGSFPSKKIKHNLVQTGYCYTVSDTAAYLHRNVLFLTVISSSSTNLHNVFVG